MSEPTSSDRDAEALEAVVLARIHEEHGPVAWLKSRRRAPRFAMLVGLFVLEGAFFWSFLRRNDFDSLPTLRMALAFGGSALLLIGAAWLSLRPLYLPEVRGARALLIGVGLLLPVVYALLPEFTNGRAPATVDKHISSAYVCFANGVLVAGLVFALARLLDRGGLGTVLSAVAGGMAGFFMLNLHCPNMFPAHLLLGHATVPAALILAGYLVSRLRRTA